MGDTAGTSSQPPPRPPSPQTVRKTRGRLQGPRGPGGLLETSGTQGFSGLLRHVQT